ncbi:uncharacterized protein LOC121764645 isoform X1 [Salvia splendens]|uniref:uncharacterized protein LOC121764645 isoform X1 n=1 Tax=Salvia splendens TaxID=180675 RepID=UPI001C265576|nr:uncharacterized protein LOC121764645 isoform X1 [Salvia splendens]XP_042016600.1 uncharacterized protein LOC121764645 isoform X1 [Salvia splendens]
MAERRRQILRNFLSPEICKELEFIHKSCCTIGYRPNVFSTTLSHLIATNSPHLIMPFVPIRERLKEKVEEYFGCEYELFVEFTGLISWCKGASIGWHSDDNSDHLKQRDFSAVCYLNSYEVDFLGGLFHFQDGEPSTIAPMAGDVVIYTADERNIHSVSEISEGERITLALWFSRDASHDEDANLLKSLSNFSPSSPVGSIASCFPVLASTNMYWFPPEEASRFQRGFNICSARLCTLGFDVCFSDESDKECQFTTRDSCSINLKVLEEPLYLTCGDALLTREFVNILHALQVVQFYYWKASEFDTDESTDTVYVPLSELQQQKITRLRAVLVKDLQLAETLIGRIDSQKPLEERFRSRFSDVVCKWEAYTSKLHNELVMSLPYWVANHFIFCTANYG